MTTREELQHEIDVRAEERSEYEGSRQCRRTEELDEQLALYKLALIGLDAQELQERLRVTADDRAALFSENLGLKAQLRTARSDALEEAAKVADELYCHMTIYPTGAAVPRHFHYEESVQDSIRAMIGAGK